MMRDPFREGLAAGWNHIDASALVADQALEADVVIVGSGAGGGVTAELLTGAGLKVIIVEEGPLRTSSDFRMLESEAYPMLYQESASRHTADKAIKILQGRCVGGSTTVNWTSSFRTPQPTLHWWQTAHGLKNLSVEAMAPWFAAMEQRLHVGLWPLPPNENNAALARGAEKLGIPVAVILRNVKMCWNLGYCGMGCAMADAPERGVVSDEGHHFQIDNLSVHDGSLFPTSIGANPQLSIYGLVARNASLLAAALSGRPRPAIL